MSSSRDRPVVSDLIEFSDPSSPTTAAPRSIFASVDVWRDELLPDWTQRCTDPVMRKRMLQGVPPEVQGELWFIGFALPANYDDGIYETCRTRVAELRERMDADDSGHFRKTHGRLCGDLLTIDADVPRALSDFGVEVRTQMAAELRACLEPLVAELLGSDPLPLDQVRPLNC